MALHEKLNLAFETVNGLKVIGYEAKRVVSKSARRCPPRDIRCSVVAWAALR